MSSRIVTMLFVGAIAAGVSAAPVPCASRMAIPAPSVEDGTMPPAEYVKDYYAPPMDWFPVQAVADYTIQTWIPELTWLKYDGTYALELKVAPADPAQISKNIACELIDTNKNANALVYNDKFTGEVHRRRIAVKNLDRSATNMTAFCFKLRASDAGLAARGVKAVLRGKDLYVEADTAKAENLSEIVAKAAKDSADLKVLLRGKTVREDAKDGFVQYRIEFTPRPGSRLDEIMLEFPAVGKSGERPVFEIIDLHCPLREKEAQFTDLPQRQWIEKAQFASGAPLKAADGIADVNAWMDAHPDATMELPLDNARLADGSKSSGYRLENLTLNPKTLKPVADGGKGIPALRITFRKGEKTYLKFAKHFNGIEYNTIGFYAKVEVPKDVRPFGLYNETYSGFHGALDPFGHNDVFGFGYYSANFDHVEWGKMMVAPGHNKVYEQKTAAPLPDGWKKIAFDNRYSDPAHNKISILDDVTDWFISYDNSTIDEGKEVVITIARPRVAKGLMHAGGDMQAYRKFLADAPNRLLKNCGEFDYRKYLGAPAEGRLAQAIPFIREHQVLGEFVFPREWAARDLTPFRKTVTDALDYFEDLLKNKYGLAGNIPRRDEPSKSDNAKIIVGGDWYARLGADEKAQYDRDRELLKGTTGFAIRSKGKNIYIYAGTFEDFGSMLGLANGVWALIEGNTDEISLFSGRGAPIHVRVFDFERTGEMDLVWGDGYVEKPLFSRAYCFYANGIFLRRNRSVDYEAGWSPESFWAGGNRKLYTGHWLAHFGSMPGLYSMPADIDPEHECWGMDPYGKRIKPDCYTRHCCMIKVVDNAKNDWLFLFRRPMNVNAERFPFKYPWQFYDTVGYCLEDNDKWCLCEKCRTPIRLADGSSIGPENALFRGTQYFSNASAMIHSINVWINRAVRCQTLGYFWMNTPPPFQLSRNWEVCYCPYFRKNYFEPIYAPVNDLWARDLYRWGQLPGVRMSIYDYFLGVNLRPWEITAKYDFPFERDCGITEVHNEGGNMFATMALWSVLRQFRRADADPRESDRFFIARAFREAAPAMEKFYSCINEFIFENIAQRTYMEMEDYAIIGVVALRTPSKKSGLFRKMSVLDELDGYIREAQAAVKTPLAAKALDAFVNGFEGGDRWCYRAWSDEARRRAAEHKWPEK